MSARASAAETCMSRSPRMISSGTSTVAASFGGVLTEHVDEESLHLGANSFCSAGACRDVDRLAVLELVEGAHRRTSTGALAGFARSCSRITSPSLRPAPATRIDAANPFGLLRRRKRDQCAFAMPEHPDAFRSGPVADRRYPNMRVACIIGDRHRVGSVIAALLPNMPRLSIRTLDTPLAASPRQAGGRCCGHAHRIVAVAIGRARPRDDQHDWCALPASMKVPASGPCGPGAVIGTLPQRQSP